MSNEVKSVELSGNINALSEKDNGIEYQEEEEHFLKPDARVLMAKNMKPSKEEWEQLGFVFTDIANDDVLCLAILPEGWTIKEIDSMWKEIIDENGMRRGSMFYRNGYGDRNASMTLECRYWVWEDYVDDKKQTREIYFGNKEEKIYIAGKVRIRENMSNEQIIEAYSRKKKYESLAKQFADMYYPDWQNVHAYWENVEQRPYSWLLKRSKR